MSRIARLMPTVFSRTYANSFINGNFSNGTNGWNTAGVSSFSVTNGTASFMATTFILSTVSKNLYQMAGIQNGKSLYITAFVYGPTTLKIGFSNAFVSSGPPSENVWDWISCVYVVSSPSSRALGLSVKADDLNKECKCTRFAVINLTNEFGAGNEPNAAWCDMNIRPNIVW